MDADTQNFRRLRPRLLGIAYRMLGSSAEAEDVVQDAWLRYAEADRAPVDNVDAWLVTVTTRLSIDRLRVAKARREQYVGFWLPEPLLTDVPNAEATMELADDLSVAFLMLLERLAPEARAAFLLREVFDADYDELASTIGKSEAACRQIVHRAKEQLRSERPRYNVPREKHDELMLTFTDAVRRGDFESIRSLLADNCELIGDGGGKASSFPKPIVGARQIATLFAAVARRHGNVQRLELVPINGELGLLRYTDGALESAECFETDGERITRIHIQRNPDKLRGLSVAITPPPP